MLWPEAGTGRDVGRRPATSSETNASLSRVRRGVKALVTREDQVLLIEERRPRGSTFWTLPGGGLRVGETPRAGLERELAEELRCGVAVDHAVTSCTYHHVTRPGTVTAYTVYTATLEDEPVPNRDEGVTRLRWTTRGSLPSGTLEPFRAVIDGHAARKQD